MSAKLSYGSVCVRAWEASEKFDEIIIIVGKFNLRCSTMKMEESPLEVLSRAVSIVQNENKALKRHSGECFVLGYGVPPRVRALPRGGM